jgi:hypothetical protein
MKKLFFLLLSLACAAIAICQAIAAPTVSAIAMIAAVLAGLAAKTLKF